MRFFTIYLGEYRDCSIYLFPAVHGTVPAFPSAALTRPDTPAPAVPVLQAGFPKGGTGRTTFYQPGRYTREFPWWKFPQRLPDLSLIHI